MQCLRQVVDGLRLETLSVEEERGCALDAEGEAVGHVGPDSFQGCRTVVGGVEGDHVQTEVGSESAEQVVGGNLLLGIDWQPWVYVATVAWLAVQIARALWDWIVLPAIKRRRKE